MARDIAYDLADCLERANPYVETVIEISEPNVSHIIRRPDQFTTTPPLVAGSMAPANSIGGAPNGGAQIVPAEATLAQFLGETAGEFYLNREDPERRKKGVSWEVDPAFVRGVLRSFKIRVGRLAWAAALGYKVDFELQIYRVVKTPGVKQTFVGGSQQYRTTAFTEYQFVPLLAAPALKKASSLAWDGDQEANVEFDLKPYGLVLENLAPDAAAPDQAGDIGKYHFVVTGIGLPKSNDYYWWLRDKVTARQVGGVGTFKHVYWARDNAEDQWSEDDKTFVPHFVLKVDSYGAASQADYDIDLGALPSPLAQGRVVFERILPPGTSATLSLSTDGGGSWAPVKQGDPVAVVQQTYRLRLVLNPDAALRSSPIVTAIGIEFRIPTDVTVEAIPALPSREISPPWLKASIGESTIRIVRTGIRDFLDVATRLGSTQPATRLEADIFLASRHPSVTRDKWLRLERLLVGNRVPDATSESFTLLSYLSKLKKKIPQKQESISSVHTVTSATTDYVRVTPNLPGVGVGENLAYDGKRYYMRVRTSAVGDMPPNHQQEIQGNTGQDQLDFVPALPAALVAGDVVEVHSGVFSTVPILFQNIDPADAWDQVLGYAEIPPERVGLGYLPRGGKPPRVTDRAPGDAATQAKLKVTLRVSEEESAGDLLDQLSFIMGGATVEIDGQICFVQIFPLRALDGSITVPVPPVSAAFDTRDYTSLRTPPGLEQRATVCTAKYGVNTAAADPSAAPSKATVVADNDALMWLQRPDFDEIAASEVPDKVSRWFYNSPSTGGDEGLYLATVVTQQVVRADSTGLRVFPFELINAHPRLLPGDVVVLATENYTDYDPATGTAIAGPVAIKGVLVQVGKMGRQLAMYVTGLAENVTKLAGGEVGDLTGLGAAPDIPTIGISFNGDGTANIDSVSPRAVSHRIAFSSVSQAAANAGAPAATIVAGNPAYAVTGSAFAPGATIYVAAIAISATGLESEIGSARAIREGTGEAAKPYILMLPLLGSRTQTSETIRVQGDVATGGTEPLEYQYRIDDGAWSGWVALGASGSWVDLAVTKAKFYNKVLSAQVRDGSGVESDVAMWTIIGQHELTEPATGRLKPDVPMYSTGALPFGRGYDVASDVVELAGYKFTHGDFLDASRRIASVYRGAAVEPVGNLFKRGTDTGADVVETAGRNFVNGPMLDAGRNVVNVYRSAANEPVSNLFKRGSDTASDVVATTARTFIEPNFVDASLRPVNVYRGSVSEPVGNLFKRGADTSLEVVEAGGRSFVGSGMIDASRNVVNVYRTAVTESVANLFKRGADTASDVVEVAGRNFIEGGMIDASRRVVNVYRTAVTESVGNLFKRGTDTAADVLTTSARSYVDPALVDPSFRVTSVYRGGVNEPVNNLLKAGDAITDASLSSNIARLNTAQTWTAAQTFAAGLLNVKAAGLSAYVQFKTSAGADRGYVGYGGSDSTFYVYNGEAGDTQVLAHASLRIHATSSGGILHGAWVVIASDASAQFDIRASAVNNSVYQRFSNSAGATRGFVGFGASSSSLMYFVNSENGDILFQTNSGDRLRAYATGGGTLYGAWSLVSTTTAQFFLNAGASTNQATLCFQQAGVTRYEMGIAPNATPGWGVYSYGAGANQLEVNYAGGGSLFNEWAIRGRISQATSARLFIRSFDGATTYGSLYGDVNGAGILDAAGNWRVKVGTNTVVFNYGNAADWTVAIFGSQYGLVCDGGSSSGNYCALFRTGAGADLAYIRGDGYVHFAGAVNFASLIHVTANTTNVASSGTTVLRFLANGANLEGVWSLYNAGTPRLVAGCIPVTAYDSGLTAPEGTFQAVYTP